MDQFNVSVYRVLGLALNIVVSVIFSLLFPDSKEEQERAEEVYSWVVRD